MPHPGTSRSGGGGVPAGVAGRHLGQHGALVLLVSFVLVLFLPEVPLRKESGIQARLQEEERNAAAAAMSVPS